MKMEVAPQEEPLHDNNTEDAVASNENGVGDEIQPDVAAKEAVVEEPVEHAVSKAEEEEQALKEGGEVGTVEEVAVVPEVADPLTVEESVETEPVVKSQPEVEPAQQVDEVAVEETVAAPETEGHVTEECMEAAPVEQDEIPTLEQVVVEEAPPTELTLAEEPADDCTDKVNGMPVLISEEEAAKNGAEATKSNEDDLESEEADESHPSEAKETTIPPHILGHSLEVDDEIRNGKVRKPRLGVKIPYRNLTSQIVSKQEIAEEIMERSRIRNLTAEAPEGGDIFFTKKLTKRLATKIAPTPKGQSSASVKVEGSQKSGSSSSSSPKVSTPSKKVTDSGTKKTGETTAKKVMDTSAKINDNSDLIAILEGDDDWDLMRLKSKPLEKRTPEWERETALKQLRELPKHRGYSKSSSKSSPEKSKPPPSVEAAEEDPLQADDNQEPKFSMGLVTKTYTRKRKSSEDIKLLAATILQSQKKIISEKEKKPSSSAPNSDKVSSHSKPRTYSHKSTKNEMPSLKKESASAPVTPKHSTVPPTLTPNVDASEIPDNLQPQVIVAKVAIETKTPSPAKIVKTPLSSPNTYISKSSRIVKKKKIWDPDEETTPKYFKVPNLKSPETVHSDTPKPSVLKPNNDKTPVVKKPSIKKVMMKKKKPKRLTEVDRLLMDEGAVNLLYAVKNTDEIGGEKKKKSVISLDRAQRELKNKTNEIKNDLQINSTKDSPISLRKKEGPSKTTPTKEIAASVLHRKKSTSSANSPPASPASYNQHAEASRIIRRHSSSSFSSENPEGDDSDRGIRQKSDGTRRKIRPRSERNSSTFIIQHQDGDEVESVMTSSDEKYSRFGTFKVVTFPNFVQIILEPQPTGRTTLSVDSLTELRAMLHLLSNDDECSVVLLSSSGKTFCEGLNYKELYCNNRIECMNIAENYAMSVRDFLISLAQFPKILVAGVHGNAMGLAVTMLPLFDMVFASDAAKFSVPYASLGCAAEGGVLLSAPHVMNGALASELFFGSRKLTASDALRLGLVTRTFWPEKFQDELISVLKAIADQSQQSMQAIKMQLKDHLLSDVETLLKSESSILVQHWTSKECQANFMNYGPSK
ncbi:hypothetical protein PPYR_14163 [Photinus pyralis]|uniref:Uncharacterized protein n=1 Tax=Photinus pyralis TaxID=7054 RepID=A0A1Y1M661_PHOPY|nr:titin homolog [Photinus pyralis]KAB0792204.1 hypothetical protein PPYR_14163 [Photinus pyralis]